MNAFSKIECNFLLQFAFCFQQNFDKYAGRIPRGNANRQDKTDFEDIQTNLLYNVTVTYKRTNS